MNNLKQPDLTSLIFKKFLQAWRELDVNLLLYLLSDQFTLHKRHQSKITDLARAQDELANWFMKIIDSGYGVIIREYDLVSSHFEKMISIALNDGCETGILSLVVLLDENSIVEMIDSELLSW